MKKTRITGWIAAAAAIVAIVGLAAACGGEDTSSSSTPPVTDAAPTGADATATATAEPEPSSEAAPESIASATIGMPGQILTLDPLITFDPVSLVVLHLVGGTLYRLAGDEVVPSLAQAGEFSDDGKTLTLTLTDGVTFTDGAPLTSADVKATFERALASETNGYAGQFASIESVAAPDPATVVFTFRYSNRMFPSLLASPAFTILPATAISDDMTVFFEQPVFAGAYSISNWDGGPTATLTRNSSWPGPAPRIEQLDIVTVGDPNTRLLQTKSGQIDMAFSLPASVVPQVTGEIEQEVTQVYGFTDLGMNNKDELLSDVRIRKAIALAVDREKINQVAYGGLAEPLRGFFPPNMAGGGVDALPASPDVEAAKASLQGTACANGCQMEILTFQQQRDSLEPAAVVIQQNLETIGISTQVSVIDDATYGERVAAGDYDMVVSQLYDFSDSPAGLPVYGLQSDGGLFANFSFYASPQMDELVQEAIEAPDSVALEQTNGEISALFGTDVPYVPVTTLPFIGAVRTDLVDVISITPSGFIDVAG